MEQKFREVWVLPPSKVTHFRLSPNVGATLVDALEVSRFADPPCTELSTPRAAPTTTTTTATTTTTTTTTTVTDTAPQ